MIIVKSHYAQLPGERLRSSDYFNTTEFPVGAKLKLTVYYKFDFRTKVGEEAPKVEFDICVNKDDKNKQDAGEEHSYLMHLHSGDIIENIERENLCIADPDDAREGFTVVIDLAE